jgi:2-keto-4-pentenoate hydratase/2-oxohepta-3-ene-1,7-dioic acid hydratase in catechol pathway
MRLCRFTQGEAGDDRIGVVEGATIHDATDWIAGLLDLTDRVPGDPLVRALPAIRAATPQQPGRGIPADAVTLLSPVRRPGKIIAAPDNYRAHMAEMAASAAAHGRAMGDLETVGLFLKATSSLVGAGEGIRQRFLDQRTDYEVELVAVIGTTLANADAATALRAVAGYAVGLDITLRGPQERSLRKSIDSYSVLGPWLVTADEVGEPHDLELTLTLNGAVKQHTSTRDMVTDVGHLIAYCSRFYTLHPGDLVYTGTCSGVGPIRPGDRIEASASRIGRMNVLVSAA